jgi:hypothetical protein
MKKVVGDFKAGKIRNLSQANFVIVAGTSNHYSDFFGPSTIIAVDINSQNFADRYRTSLAYNPLNRILPASYNGAPQKILLVVVVLQHPFYFLYI